MYSVLFTGFREGWGGKGAPGTEQNGDASSLACACLSCPAGTTGLWWCPPILLLGPMTWAVKVNV